MGVNRGYPHYEDDWGNAGPLNEYEHIWDDEEPKKIDS